MVLLHCNNCNPNNHANNDLIVNCIVLLKNFNNSSDHNLVLFSKMLTKSQIFKINLFFCDPSIQAMLVLKNQFVVLARNGA